MLEIGCWKLTFFSLLVNFFLFCHDLYTMVVKGFICYSKLVCPWGDISWFARVVASVAFNVSFHLHCVEIIAVNFWFSFGLLVTFSRWKVIVWSPHSLTQEVFIFLLKVSGSFECISFFIHLCNGLAPLADPLHLSHLQEQF